MHVSWNEQSYPFILGWASMGSENGKGYMKSIGVTASEKRIGRALSVASPIYQAKRAWQIA